MIDNTKVTINGIEYDVQVEAAIRAGLLKPADRPLTIADVKVGNIFLFVFENSAGLFIQDSPNCINRLSTTGDYFAPNPGLGYVGYNCAFRNSTKIKIYHNGNFASTVNELKELKNKQ
jgi:hypothetical protein